MRYLSKKVVRALFLNALKDPVKRAAIEQILRKEGKITSNPTAANIGNKRTYYRLS